MRDLQERLLRDLGMHRNTDVEAMLERGIAYLLVEAIEMAPADAAALVAATQGDEADVTPDLDAALDAAPELFACETTQPRQMLDVGKIWPLREISAAEVAADLKLQDLLPPKTADEPRAAAMDGLC